MRPEKLTMQAFGSYGKKEIIDFNVLGNGVFLITGDTGAGKTTIFDAITFALYGDTSGQKRSGKMMRSKYATEDTDTFVELTFSYRDKQYTINRSPEYYRLSKKKNAKGEYENVKQSPKVTLIMPNGSAFNGKLKETDEKIEEIIGLNIDQFTQIAMLAQGDFLKLLHAESKERKAIFTKIFNTTFYNSACFVLKNTRNESYGALMDNENLLKNAISRIRTVDNESITEDFTQGMRILQAVNFIDDNLKKAAAIENELLTERKILEEKKTKVVSFYEKINSIIEDENKDKKNFESTQLKIKQGESKTDGLKEQLKELEMFEKEHLLEYQTEIIKLEGDMPKYDLQLKLQEEIKQCEKQVKDINKEIETLQLSLANIKKEYDKASKKAIEAINLHKEAQASYDNMLRDYYNEQAGILAKDLKDGEPCPVCGSITHPKLCELSQNAPTKKMVEDAKLVRDKLDKEKDIAMDYLAAYKQKYEEANKNYEEKADALIEKKNEYAANVLSHKNKLVEYEKELVFENISKLVTRINKLKDTINSHKKNLEIVRDEISKLNIFVGEQKGILGILDTKLKDYGNKMKNLMEKLSKEGFTELLDVKLQLDDIEQKIKDNNKQSKELYSLIENNKEILKEITKNGKAYEKQKEEFLVLDKLYKTYSGNLVKKSRIDFETYIQRQYFKKIIQSANKRLYLLSNNEFILKCRSIEDLSGGNAQVGLDLDVESLSNNMVRDVKTLSGGESFLAALSMALGLADVIGQTAGAIKIETMFIDEGFGNLDDNSRECSIRVLSQLAGENRMIGIISHVNELKESLNKKIYVKKTNHGSTTYMEVQ